MNSFYSSFIEKFTKDVRFKNIKLTFTEDRRKCYKNRKEYELKILRIVTQIDVNNELFLRTLGFRINYVLEEKSVEIVTNSGYKKKKVNDLDYKKISLFIYESIEDLKRKDLSISKIL